MSTPLLHTDRLRLRAPEPEDVEQMFLFENDETLWENGGVTGPYSRYQLKTYIAETKNDLFSDGQLRLMMETADGTVIGIADLFDFDARNRRAEVGIAVCEAYRRKGFGTEALALLERHCFGYIGIHQLYAHVRESNRASMKLFQQAGYVLSGTLVHWLCRGGQFQDVCVWQKIYREIPIGK